MKNADDVAVTRRVGRRLLLRVGGPALAVLCVALLAPVALGGKPDRERVPIGQSFTAAPGEVCSFGVKTTLVGGNQTWKFFDSGKFLATGKHVDEITNLDTGASVVLELEGSIADVPKADGSGSFIRASGVTAFALFPGDAGPGDIDTGRIYVFTGNVRIETDADGVYTSLASTGPPRDVCAMIG